LAYRACVRITGRAAPSALAAAAYGASAVMLWAFSDGRFGLLVALAVLPALLERFEGAFSADPPMDERGRFLTGLGVTIAVGVAFEPGIALAVAIVLVVQILGGSGRRRGLAWSLGGILAACVLLFPFVPTVVAGGAAALGSSVGSHDPWDLLRLSPGVAPGSWVVAWFLPIAALAGLALASGERRAPALRAGAVATIALGLAWTSAAGYLPAQVSNTPVYVAVAAACEALLVALGAASAAGGMGRVAFGFRQIGAGVMALALGLGLSGQALAVITGGWAVGLDRVAPAWAVVDSTATGRFRVLWIGADDGRSFPAPGGDPDGLLEAGDGSLRYAVTERTGTVAIDIGRPLVGPGADALRASITQIVTGSTVHGGALLAPFGIRYVVADETRLPEADRHALDAQNDLDLVPASGLVIWRSASVLPLASVASPSPAQDRLLSSGSLGDTQRIGSMPAVRLEPVEGGWDGATGGGTRILLSTEFDGAWQVRGDDRQPERAFGWATSFRTSAPTVSVRYGAQLPRSIATGLLAVVWAAALWITRKPVRR
jgi:hypothetical protein